MRTIINAAVLALGGLLGWGAIALWAALEPQRVENVSTMDPTSAVVIPFTPPGAAWFLGVAFGVFCAYVALRYFRRI